MSTTGCMYSSCCMEAEILHLYIGGLHSYAWIVLNFKIEMYMCYHSHTLSVNQENARLSTCACFILCLCRQLGTAVFTRISSTTSRTADSVFLPRTDIPGCYSQTLPVYDRRPGRSGEGVAIVRVYTQLHVHVCVRMVSCII